MSIDIFEEKTKEVDLDVVKIIKMLKDSRTETPGFLNGVLIGFYTFDVLMDELRHLRYGIDNLLHTFIMIQGREAEQRTHKFVTQLVKGELVMPALEKKE